ncbi:hypothetical protein KCU89_g66, partial [Aureobasidium melanogenum]
MGFPSIDVLTVIVLSTDESFNSSSRRIPDSCSLPLGFLQRFSQGVEIADHMSKTSDLSIHRGLHHLVDSSVVFAPSGLTISLKAASAAVGRALSGETSRATAPVCASMGAGCVDSVSTATRCGAKTVPSSVVNAGDEKGDRELITLPAGQLEADHPAATRADGSVGLAQLLVLQPVHPVRLEAESASASVAASPLDMIAGCAMLLTWSTRPRSTCANGGISSARREDPFQRFVSHEGRAIRVLQEPYLLLLGLRAFLEDSFVTTRMGAQGGADIWLYHAQILSLYTSLVDCYRNLFRGATLWMFQQNILCELRKGFLALGQTW